MRALLIVLAALLLGCYVLSGADPGHVLHMLAPLTHMRL